MAKNSTHYTCQQCGAQQPKWSGRCLGCSAWNTLVEEQTTLSSPRSLSAKRGNLVTLTSLSDTIPVFPRAQTGVAEFDRVCGGGMVPGSVLLVGGDPGIGKSTLLLQVVASLSKHMTCCYISGEEGVDQVRMRALRLGITDSNLQLAAATNISDILTTLAHGQPPSVVVIDSIQTMFSENIESAPGSVGQVRLCTQELIHFAKKNNTIVILVGHVTKEGVIAGPRVLEHMVDTVLYFEGERGHHFRILRGVKNRFGATDEIGVFEMTHQGLMEVSNPSALFLAERAEAVSGSAVFAGIEGTRPILVEIQALVAPSAFGTPRRAVIGWDSSRLAMVIAVLESRCGIVFGARDIYLNVAGGLKIQEPAADLAVAVALVSALMDQALPSDAIFFGEVGLSGEIRSVSQTDARLKEAAKLGFKRAIAPKIKRSKNDQDPTFFDLKIDECRLLNDIEMLFTSSTQDRKESSHG